MCAFPQPINRSLQGNEHCFPKFKCCVLQGIQENIKALLFSEHFPVIHSNLKEMSLGGSKQRDRAHELFNGIGIDTSVFFVCLVIIATYSVILKTITQLLQSVNMDVQRMRDEISDLLHRFQSHRLNAEAKFPETFSKASVIAERMATTIEMSRRSKQFTQRDKYDAEKPEEYYRVSLYIPYIDSLTRYKHVSATITTL